MKIQESCPLCCSKELVHIEKIKTHDLISLWLKKKINVKRIFKNINTLNKIKCNNCSLCFFDPSVSGDNTFYSALGKEEWYYLHEDKTEFGYSDGYIKYGDNILDIGSGRGIFQKYITKKITYTGLELSKKAAEDASRDGINVVEDTIEHYSKSNHNKYDVVVTFQVIEHIKNIDSFLKSSISVIRSGGLLIIACPNNNSFIRKSQNNLWNLPPHHLLHWNRDSLEYIAKKYDLEIVDTYKEKVSNTHKDWYYATKIQEYITNIFGLEKKSISVSQFHIAIRKISFVLAKLLMFSSKYCKSDGHTIVMVFEKK